uniref:Uncharacterized protein n=1 Tax=Arundo donax TaxID=35708 RepID=A0A0A9GLP7_ARUDO
MAVDRGCYIDQSQSLNVHMEQPNFGKLTSLHFHAWSKGLKTGMYYLRTRAAADAIKFTVDTALLKENGVRVLSLNSICICLQSYPKQLLKQLTMKNTA